jgi:hypothetical protein
MDEYLCIVSSTDHVYIVNWNHMTVPWSQKKQWKIEFTGHLSIRRWINNIGENMFLTVCGQVDDDIHPGSHKLKVEIVVYRFQWMDMYILYHELIMSIL